MYVFTITLCTFPYTMYGCRLAYLCTRQLYLFWWRNGWESIFTWQILIWQQMWSRLAAIKPLFHPGRNSATKLLFGLVWNVTQVFHLKWQVYQRPCRKASSRGTDPGSFTRQCMYRLGKTEWHLDRFFAMCFGYSVANTIPPIFHVHSPVTRGMVNGSDGGRSSRDMVSPYHKAIKEKKLTH